MLKRVIIPLFLFALLFSTANFAQPKPQPPTKEEMLTHLSKKLALDDKQVEKIDEILTNSRDELENIHKKMREANKKLIEEEKKVIENVDAEIEKNLNDTQKKIFEEMKKERENRSPLPPPPPAR